MTVSTISYRADGMFSDGYACSPDLSCLRSAGNANLAPSMADGGTVPMALSAVGVFSRFNGW